MRALPPQIGDRASVNSFGLFYRARGISLQVIPVIPYSSFFFLFQINIERRSEAVMEAPFSVLRSETGILLLSLLD